MSQHEVYYENGQEPIARQPTSTHHTTIVIQQQAPQTRCTRQWRSGLFSCCDDIPICLLVTFCQPCFGCYLATEAGESCCLAFCCEGWLVALRSHVRGRLKIQGSICSDFCATACCASCVMCQLAREIKESKDSGEW